MKTVSLAEALKSGKSFRYRLDTTEWKTFQFGSGKEFTPNEILAAECQIIEEPIERWAWINMAGEVVGLSKLRRVSDGN